MRILRFFVALTLLIRIDLAYGQNPLSQGCGTDEIKMQLRRDPKFAAEEAKLNQDIRNLIQRRSVKAQNLNSPLITAVYTIPVVYHIVLNDPTTITDMDIANSLNDLNQAFAHLGAYSGDPKGADTKIQFCLARTAPDGGITNGIDRISTFWGANDKDLEGFQPSTLSEWDRSNYVNIWIVNSIQGEALANFECGAWKRSGVGGYAAPGKGLVVAGLSTPVIAHEMGHYLSLLHTFEGTSCLNTDCTVQGDQVCDTPPDRSTNGSLCSSPENSCNTDTVSGPFTSDVPDYISNFMDYGSPCPSMFTQGQADRMRAFLEVFNGGSLIASTRCQLPCAESIQTSFNWYLNPQPITGQTVTFTNTTTGATNMEWYVDNVLTSTATDLTYTFNTAGSYTVKLKAYNASTSCFGSYEGKVIVNCGVTARFSPTERILASNELDYPDSTLFVNKSYGATNYEWHVSDENGLNMQTVSTNKDLSILFKKSGSYKIQLIASNATATCTSASPIYTLPVFDPRMDLIPYINAVDCYKNDSIRVVFTILNNGYDTIPSGTLIEFFDQPSTVPGAQLLLNTFPLPNEILGKCARTYTHILKSNSPLLNYIYLIGDRSKTLSELYTNNNSKSGSGFKIQTSINPPLQKVYANTQVNLALLFNPGKPKSILWDAPASFSCTACDSPKVTITDTTYFKAYTVSTFGCLDTANALVTVYPYDISINAKEIFCYKNDSLLIKGEVCLGNGYTNLKNDLQIRIYDDIPSAPNAACIDSLQLSKSSVFTNGCLAYTKIIKKPKTYFVHLTINEALNPFEETLTNNNSAITAKPFSISLSPTSLVTYRNEQEQLIVTVNGEKATKYTWTPTHQLSCANCKDPILTPLYNDKYRIIAESEYGCVDSAFLSLQTYYQNTIALPNTFTPNGDGRNDNFYVIAGTDIAKVKQLSIYNRWGQLVFESRNTLPNDPKLGWNGTYKGNRALTGTYIYNVILERTDGTTFSQQGNITIL